jgi:hypothetical protein
LLAKLKSQLWGTWEVIDTTIRFEGRYRIVRCRCTKSGVERDVPIDNLVSGKSRGPRGVNAIKNGGEARGYGFDQRAKVLGERFDAIHQRCNNPRSPYYPGYGGRGIRLEFTRDQFIKWILENLPHQSYRGVEIDREHNDGHYTPGNLRLVPKKANLRNTRRNRFIEYAGQQVIVADLWHLLKTDYPNFDLSHSRTTRLAAEGYSVQTILRTKSRRRLLARGPTQADAEIVTLYRDRYRTAGGIWVRHRSRLPRPRSGTSLRPRKD